MPMNDKIVGAISPNLPAFTFPLNSLSIINNGLRKYGSIHKVYSIQNYEPRVKLIDVKSYPDYDNNSFDVTIVYQIIGADVPAQQLQFILQPTR